MVGFIVARPEAGEFVQFVMRDLSQPSEALDIIASGGISARDFVDAEEPLENLSSVLFRLAEGTNTLKTAIIP